MANILGRRYIFSQLTNPFDYLDVVHGHYTVFLYSQRLETNREQYVLHHNYSPTPALHRWLPVGSSLTQQGGDLGGLNP